ncbi:MAG TPA: ketoacyl-ACP synthase III [Ohtaekwangia sp.]
MQSVIVGTGSYIPEIVVPNANFITSQFFEKDGTKLYKNKKSIIEKFQEITGISERRYAKPEQNASHLAYLSALNALHSSGVDKETLDYIIVAHNFGDVTHQNNRVNTLPTLASKVKALLKIQNPDCVAYDLPFGCPGWVEGLIQANYFIRSGDASSCLVIGTETLSRVIDPHDRDSMLYSDGSGAVILQSTEVDHVGILSHKTQTHTLEHAFLLNMNSSYSPFSSDKNDLFLKMNGRKVYEFAIEHVPPVIKTVLDKANVPIHDISKIIMHQANDKLNQAILQRVFKLYGLSTVPSAVMPMTIDKLGNSSVASIPTLLDLILKGKMQGHSLNQGDKIIIASVGAGMNINAMVYQF